MLCFVRGAGAQVGGGRGALRASPDVGRERDDLRRTCAMFRAEVVNAPRRLRRKRGEKEGRNAR